MTNNKDARKMIDGKHVCDCEICHPDLEPEVDEAMKCECVDYKGLEFYTREFKEWIWKLFRKAHARMGHIEEDLARVKRDYRTDYQLIPATNPEGDKLQYTLVETITDTDHGSIEIDLNGALTLTKWEEDLAW